MADRYYTFYDTTLVLNLPDAVQEQWDLLYGSLASKAGAAEKIFRIELKEYSKDDVRIEGDTPERRVSVTTAMMHLQDVVQNEVVGSVTSHHLYHGACWSAGDCGLMILAESGVGKTTLSLSHMANEGLVLSDEIAAWNPGASRLEAFPRAMAVRPASLIRCGVQKAYPALDLDEVKNVVALDGASSGASVQLAAVVILSGERDESVEYPLCFELRVYAKDRAWMDDLKHHFSGLHIETHPDGEGWFRCHSGDPARTGNLHEVLDRSGAVLTGFHRGAYRLPDYGKDPVIERISDKEASEEALAHLLNARHLASQTSPAALMGGVRAMMRGLNCYRCVPGKLADTVHKLRETVSSGD